MLWTISTGELRRDARRYLNVPGIELKHVTRVSRCRPRKGFNAGRPEEAEGVKLEFGGEGVPRASGHDGRVGEERVRRMEEGGGQFGMSLRMEGEGMNSVPSTTRIGTVTPTMSRVDLRPAIQPLPSSRREP